MALHQQLLQTEQSEAQQEKLNWDSAGKLQVMIDSHQLRIEKIGDNPAGVELVAYDRQSIVRLQQRIVDLAELARARAAEQAQEAADDAANARNQ
jgi:hypothetical protein